MDQDLRTISTTEELKIVSDPFRLSIINAYHESDEPLTVKKCAEILGEVPAKVHYHVQKLLSINILELDHVEVINGINAKFYKLPKGHFMLQLSDDTDDAMKTNLEHLTNIVISKLENFKMDFLNMTREAIAHKEESPYEVGWMSSTNVYLSETEFDELQKYLFEKISQYDIKDKSKRRYTFITGLSRKK